MRCQEWRQISLIHLLVNCHDVTGGIFDRWISPQERMKSPLKWHNLSGKTKKGLVSLCFFWQNPSVALLSTKSNMTNSICTISCFLHSSSSETLIFMFLGVRVVTENHVWHTQFVFVTLIFILIYRALGNLLHFKNSNLRPGSNEQSYCSRSLAWTTKTFGLFAKFGFPRCEAPASSKSHAWSAHETNFFASLLSLTLRFQPRSRPLAFLTTQKYGLFCSVIINRFGLCEARCWPGPNFMFSY